MPYQGHGGGSRARGTRWEAFKQLMFRTYGDSCHICTHGGARQADHLEPVGEDPAREWDLANIRPAHGAPNNPCPTCSARAGRKIHCNQIRGGMSVERARRVIAGYTGSEIKDNGRESSSRDSGRDWLRFLS